MIEKIPDQIPVQTGEWRGTTFDIIPKETFGMACRKINELVDTVNKLKTMAENTNTVLKSLVEENNIHEKQIDELQMKLEPEKCEKPVDPYAEQRKWVGKLCRCWDSDINDDVWGILQGIKNNKTEKYYLYGIGYEHCEPVKPDDDIIYKGE